MGRESCGSWVNCVMGHMDHGSRKMTHFHLRSRMVELYYHIARRQNAPLVQWVMGQMGELNVQIVYGYRGFCP